MGSRLMTVPAAGQRTYEDFEPSTEWANEPNADTLILYVPGFRKEQLKVQLSSSRILRISGERQVGENKWSRFRNEVPVSSNYDANAISAKYERGILYIRLPKIITPEAKTPHQEETAAEVTEPQGKMQPSPEAPLHPQEPSVQESPEKVIPREKPRRDENPDAETSMDEEKKGKTEDGSLANGNEHVSLHENLRRRKENGNTTDEGAVDDGGKVSTASALETAKMIKGKAVAAIASGNAKIRTGNYSQALSGLGVELRQPRKLMKLGVTIFCVLVVVMYAINVLRSLENLTTKLTLQ